MNNASLEVYIKRDLFQEVFVKTNRAKYTESLQVFNTRYLEVLLQTPFLSVMSQNVGDIDMSVLPLIVKGVIINKSRNTLFLVDEYDKRKVTIPGGHVSNYRMCDCVDEISLIEFNLIRELCEEFKIGRSTKPYEQIAVPPIGEVLMSGGFRLIEMGSVHYTLNDKLGLTLYIPLYVDDYYIPDNAVGVNVKQYLDWLDKGKLDRIARDCTYSNDIRSNEYSYILANICRTTQLF